MQHLGNILDINGAEIEPVHCISFGSPCQDLSCAGKRAGLAGERSGLFMEAVRIFKEMRCKEYYDERQDELVRYPRYAMWENVPGCQSSGETKGADFRCVLEELGKVKDETFHVPECSKWSKSGYIRGNGFSIAWRIMDAQYYGVPQRRRRMCVLADFDGYTAGDILFHESYRVTSNSSGELPLLGVGTFCGSEVQPEFKSFAGNLEPCTKEWKGIARNPEECTGECD